MSDKTSLSYQSAGVNIDAGNELVKRIKPLAASTYRPGVLGQLGGFGGLFALPLDRYKQPVLVSGTDGVGTKLKLAHLLKQHDTIGIDLVAMCANDLIVCGAEPLFFLDYYATGALNVDVAAAVVAGIAEGCKQSGMALIGGETAEMPGMYQGEDYDLAGFCVGIVEKDNIIDGSTVQVGDQLIGLASSGPHSNGYSLIRKILERSDLDLDAPFAESTLGKTLLAPTRIYVQTIQALLQKKLPIKAMAHITGGGLLENIPRVLPENCQARLHKNTWQIPAIFNWLQKQGNVADAEMYRTFNCGIGMVLCVTPEFTNVILDELKNMNESATVIGEIIAGDRESVEVV